MTPTTPGFRALSLVAALAAWALVVVGGVVRVTESGLGCPDWPLCHGKAVPKSEKTAILEYSHRATAAIVTVLLVAVAIWAWRRYRGRPEILLPALAGVLSVPFQAVLGAVVVWLELPGWIVGIHFVLGMLMLAAAVLTAVAAWRPPRAVMTEGFADLARVSVLLGLALVSAGALVVSVHAEHACGQEWPACNGSLAAGGSDASIQVIHRLLAYVVAGFTIALAVQVWRGRGPRALGSLPLAATVAQMAFGISFVLVGEGTGHDVLRALHVAGSATVWALLVALAGLAGLPRLSPRSEYPVSLPGHIR